LSFLFSYLLLVDCYLIFFTLLVTWHFVAACAFEA
jgi:hypothetical protein